MITVLVNLYAVNKSTTRVRRPGWEGQEWTFLSVTWHARACLENRAHALLLDFANAFDVPESECVVKA